MHVVFIDFLVMYLYRVKLIVTSFKNASIIIEKSFQYKVHIVIRY